MASPRIFISSTCYDLQEVRAQLRIFVESFGYIPVMSDYGDIFYDYKKHIQDSCKDEVEKCQLFILIIGNNYGSIYHRVKEAIQAPDSVTLQEFKKAIEIDIYKHIFINKFVDYDYKNYKKALTKYISNYIEENEIPENEIDQTVSTLKNNFNSTYPFPQESYNYIFNFMELVYDLKTNNAIITYESFDDIKEAVKKQWAGFVYDSLTKNKSVAMNALSELNNKTDRIENQIRALVEGQVKTTNKNDKLTFDISNLIKEVNTDSFINLRDEIHSSIHTLLYHKDVFLEQSKPRIKFREKITQELFQKWIDSIDKRIKSYKWAQSISVEILFRGIGVPYSFWKIYSEVPYDNVLKFLSIYKSISTRFEKEDLESLNNVLISKFNELFEPKPKIEGDDLPF